MSFKNVCSNKMIKSKKKKTKTKRTREKIISQDNDEIGNTLDQDILSTSALSTRSACSFYMDNRKNIFDGEYDSEPDRSSPLWKIIYNTKVSTELNANTSDDFSKKKLNLWDEIMTGKQFDEDYEDKRHEYHCLLETLKPYEPQLPICSKLSAIQYLEKNIFGILCSALEDTLHKAKDEECLMIQKSRFNGLDCLSELLWNRNPLHPKRRNKYRNIFDIPFVIIWLYYNPRPIYPLSWLWSKEEAIIVLQKFIRRYRICKEPECSEMREFWKVLKREKEEQKQARRLKSIEQIEAMFNEIFDHLIAEAVFEAEWKIWGCRCVQKPCHCTCKCNKWCKCCNCFKIPIHDATLCNCSKL